MAKPTFESIFSNPAFRPEAFLFKLVLLTRFLFFIDLNVGLAIQCVGVLLITLLSIFMRSSIKSNALNYWTASWASLSLSLISLFVGFQLDSQQSLLYSGYFFGEYVFG